MFIYLVFTSDLRARFMAGFFLVYLNLGYRLWFFAVGLFILFAVLTSLFLCQLASPLIESVWLVLEIAGSDSELT